jgi:hypothetical protein
MAATCSINQSISVLKTKPTTSATPAQSAVPAPYSRWKRSALKPKVAASGGATPAKPGMNLPTSSDAAP